MEERPYIGAAKIFGPFYGFYSLGYWPPFADWAGFGVGFGRLWVRAEDMFLARRIPSPCATYCALSRLFLTPARSIGWDISFHYIWIVAPPHNGKY